MRDLQVKDICNELDVRSLCHKILQNVSTLLNADRGSLFLVQGGGLSACQHDHHHRSATKRMCSPRPQASITVGCLSKDDHLIATAAAEQVSQLQQTHQHRHHHHLHQNRHHATQLQLQLCTDDDLVPNSAPPPSPPPSPPPCMTTVPPPIEEAAVGGLVVGSPIGSTNVGSLQAPLNVTTAATSHHYQGCQSKCLVSKLFDVCSRSTLQEMEKKKEIHIPWGTGIVGHVAKSGEPVNIPDAYKVYLHIRNGKTRSCLRVGKSEHENSFTGQLNNRCKKKLEKIKLSTKNNPTNTSYCSIEILNNITITENEYNVH